jgi:glycosyltransferase involved in cell wall biosynthesis
MKVSVVLCTFNGELFIEEQLKSIAQQTRVPDEVLIFDDRSTDSTVEIVESVYAISRITGLISINETRLGIEENFSRAMCKANGDVIFFCDQDDVWLPERVEKMITPFQEDNKVSLVYSDGYIVGPELESSGYTLFSKRPSKKLQKGDTRHVGERLKQGRAPGIKASSMVFASWVRDLAGPMPDGVAHDSWIAFFGYALGRVVAINEPLHYYRRHDQTSGKSSTNKLIPGLKHVKKTHQVFMLKEKARLAQCIYDRMCYLEHEMEGKRLFNKRFEELKLDSKEAARTLKARENIVGSSRWLSRIIKGIVFLIKGDYIAVTGYKQKIRLFCRDIGLSSALRR